MLNRVEFVIENKDINIQMGSLFHGFLMENIDTKYAEIIHQSSLNPYNQFLYFDKSVQSYVWRINTISKIAYEEIILPLSENLTKAIYLKHKDMNVGISEVRKYDEISIEDFAQKIYIDKPKKNIKIIFSTPTSFKTNGYYEIFPRIDLLFKSPAKKINMYSSVIKTFDVDAFKFLEESTSIFRYNLMSTKYHLEKTKINSFKGDIALDIRGNDEIKRLACFLLKFAEYSGVGIKTSLGMGGIFIE